MIAWSYVEMITMQSAEPQLPRRRWVRSAGQMLLFSAAHFALAIGTAFVGFGWDMDQLRSRSAVSRAGAAISETLMYPHDAALRQVPNAWLIRNLWIIPSALLLHSLLWGAFLFFCWKLWNRKDGG
jgi:hypothetical protein